MESPDLSGPLEGLKILDAGDLPRYKAAITAAQQNGWAYYFPNLLARKRPGRSTALLLEDEGTVCIFLWRLRDGRQHLNLYLPPAPMNASVLKRCLERANDFNGDRSARIMRIDEKDVDAVKAAKIRVKKTREQYIFAPRAYDDMSGKSLYTIRRNVKLVERLPDVEVVPYSRSHARACHALLDRWIREHRDVHGNVDGAGTSRRAIDLVGTLPESELRGQVVFVDGRLAAFAFGGEIRPGLAISFERKCDTSIRGLGYFQLLSLLKSLERFERVNDGSDAKRAGLRQLKSSFRPVAMHVEHRGIQRQ